MFIRKIIISFFMFLQGLVSAQADKITSYTQQDAWKKLQERMPENYRLDENNQPQEYFWQWQNNQVHVDFYPNPQSPAKVILLHGVGTNGRQMSLVLGHPLAQAGYETMSLDLLVVFQKIKKKKAG